MTSGYRSDPEEAELSYYQFVSITFLIISNTQSDVNVYYKKTKSIDLRLVTAQIVECVFLIFVLFLYNYM